MMKPVISVVYDNNEPIVVISKDISGLDTYDRAREIRKFCASEVKQLECMVDYIIIDKLNDYGIIPLNDDEESIESAFAKLYREYGVKIKIVDAYEDFKGKVVHRKLNQTCIEEDGEISIANKIMEEKEND